MAHTIGNLWDNVVDFENMYFAYRAAGHGKRYRYESLRFAEELEENLITLQNELIWGMYHPRPPREFYVLEPKKRLISAPAFRDRVVHHALVRVIEPVFERKFVKETFACRTGLGTHAAMQHMLWCSRVAKRRWGSYYVLKCDIRKFFPSINHDVLKRTVRRSIRDRDVLQLIDTIIDSHGESGRGIPIGALTSQLLANVYMDPLDHFLKEECRVKYYARHMDDFVILHQDKRYLQGLLCEIEAYLHDRLDVNLNPKTGIFPGSHGIDFCGYRIWPTHIKPRKSTVKRAKRRLKKLASVYRDNPRILEHAKNSIQSFLGYIKHCSGWRTTLSVLRKATFKASKQEEKIE